MAYLEVPVWTPLFLLRRRLRQSVELAVAHVQNRASYATVLDVGCGTMPYKSLILNGIDNTSYEGADIIINEAIRYQIDPDRQLIPDVPDGYADLVVTFETLEHVAQTHAFLAELGRVCKPGGYLILTVPFMFEYHPCPGDFYRFTKEGLHRLATQHGFTVELVQPTASELDSLLVVVQLSVSRRFGYVFTKPLFLVLNTLALASGRLFRPDKEHVVFNMNYLLIARKAL